MVEKKVKLDAADSALFVMCWRTFQTDSSAATEKHTQMLRIKMPEGNMWETVTKKNELKKRTRLAWKRWQTERFQMVRKDLGDFLWCTKLSPSEVNTATIR